MDEHWSELLKLIVSFVKTEDEKVTFDDLDKVYQKIKSIHLMLADKEKKKENLESLYKADMMSEISALLVKLMKLWDLKDDNAFILRILDVKARLFLILLKFTTHCPASFHLQFVKGKVSNCIAIDLKLYGKMYLKVKGTEKKDLADLLCERITEALLILDNCARTSQVRPIIEEQALKELCFFVDPQDNYMTHIILAISIIERIHPKNRIHKQLFREEFLAKLIETLVRTQYAQGMNMHVVKLQQDSIMELDTFLLTLSVFARQDDYQCFFVTNLSDHQRFLDKLLRAGTDLEIERLHKFLGLLLKHECNKCRSVYLMDLLLKHGVHVDDVRDSKLSSLGSSGGACQVLEKPAVVAASLFKCEYMKQCHAFLETLNVKDVYLEREHYRCFCEPCCNERKDDDVYNRGNPPKKYALPKGWAKFALKMSPRAAAMEIWANWHMAFHGTSFDHVEHILHVGDLLMPADKKLDGKASLPQPGYSGVDSKRVFMSPSILYIGQDEYAPPSRFQYGAKKEPMIGRVAFQVRIKPDSYQVTDLEEFKGDKKAIMKGKQIDPHFPNSDLEWWTDCRGVIMLVGILIKVENDNVNAVKPFING